LSSPLRVAFIGWGAIAGTAGRMLQDAPVEIVAVAVRNAEAERTGLPAAARLITDPSELAATRPDVVAEAAGRESVAPWGGAALDAGIVADAELYAAMQAAAERGGAQLHISSGALAGVDALAAARLMGIDTVEHRMVKPPRAWRDTPAESLCPLDDLTDATAFFSASAAETASAFPKNANVAMTTALAGIGPDETRITLIADPHATTNRHEITAFGAFGELNVSMSNNPLPDNPKSSAMAALSLVRAIQNRVNAVTI